MATGRTIKSEDIVRKALGIMCKHKVTFLQVTKEKRKEGYRFKYYDCQAPGKGVQSAVEEIHNQGIKVDRVATFKDKDPLKEIHSICIHI